MCPDNRGPDEEGSTVYRINLTIINYVTTQSLPQQYYLIFPPPK